MLAYAKTSGIWWQALKHTIASCLVIALGIILAYHFILFWMQGSVIIEEPNRIVLILETLMSFAIIAFGIERLVRT